MSLLGGGENLLVYETHSSMGPPLGDSSVPRGPEVLSALLSLGAASFPYSLSLAFLDAGSLQMSAVSQRRLSSCFAHLRPLGL